MSNDVSAQVVQLLETFSCAFDYSQEEAQAKAKFKQENPLYAPYEFAEHKHLGDGIKLKGHDEQPFVLRSNLKLTYGQINGLAGDFFGTTQPICLEANDREREQRFRDAYNTLVAPDTDANDILKTVQAEVDSLNNAKKQQEEKKGMFSDNFKPTSWTSLQWETMRVFNSTPSYLRLGAINLDHFGEDARTAYNTGHRLALRHAAQAKSNPNLSSAEKQKLLITAYTMNAFADHFLEDQFASGHLRVPRRHLLDSLDGANFSSFDEQAKNMCAKAMHDEDNKKGLMVRSPDRSEPWKVFGDGHLLDNGNRDGVDQAVKALQASADEVYEAWQNGVVPADKDFKAWLFAPILDSLTQLDNFSPLFNSEGKVRKPLDGNGPFTYVRVEDWTELRRIVEPQPFDPAQIHAGVDGWDKGYLFPTANAKAEVSAYEVKDSWGDKHEFLGGNAGATAGSYIGVDAGVHAYKKENEGSKIKIGLGVDTGAGIQHGSAEVKVLGTGISLGRETGFSFLGSEFKLKLW